MEFLELVRQRKEHLVARYRDAKSVRLQWLKDELRVRLSEVDALLTEVADPVPPADPPDSPPASEQAPKAAPAARRTSTRKPSSRRRAAASAPAPAPAKRTRGRQAPAASAGSPSPPRRKARNLSELIDPRVMVPLLKHGAMSPKDITSALDIRLLGPVMSGWKRTAERLGADLDELLVKDTAESGEDVYRLTDRGRELLAPAPGSVSQAPVAPAGASMATVPVAVVGSPEPAPAV